MLKFKIIIFYFLLANNPYKNIKTDYSHSVCFYKISQKNLHYRLASSLINHRSCSNYTNKT